jgi:hypothetical protein
MRNLKETNILFTKWKLLSREKPPHGSQIEEIHYWEDKANYKTLLLTYLLCSTHTFNSDTYLYVNISQPDPLPEGVFNGLLYVRAPP